MHVRINIPAWGAREIAAGAAAALGGDRRRKALRAALEAWVPGWSVVPLASARFGIALAVRSLGLAGRRVAVPAYVCPAVLTGLRAAPAEAVPVDCEPASFRFDPEALARLVADGEVDAVLAPNTYGLDQDFEALSSLGLPVVEDAAYQCGRADEAGRACGTRASAGVWSFNFKALTGVGGGALLVPEGAAGAAPIGELAPGGGLGELARFANYAARAVARHRIPAFLPGAEAPAETPAGGVRASLAGLREAAMSELQAAVALAQWEARARLEARQRANAELLDAAAARCAAFEPVRRGPAPPAHLYPLLVRAPRGEARAAVHRARRALHERGVQTEDPYPPCAGEPAPAARELADRLLLVPCNASLGEAQVRAVGAALEAASRELVGVPAVGSHPTWNF